MDASWAEAAKLLADGRAALARRGQLDRACEILAKSYALRRRGDTLLNLAECHRRQGKTATAWREFDEAIRFAMAVEFPEAIAAAATMRDQLAESLSELIVEIDPKSAPPDLTVILDGKKLPTPQWNEVLYVDPGVHAVTATAPGYEPFATQGEVPPKGGSTVLRITLVQLPPKPSAAPPQPAAKPPPKRVAPAPAETPIWPFVVGGAGLAAMGVSAVFLVDSRSAGAELDNDCGGRERQSCPGDYDIASPRGRELRGFGLFVGLGIAGLGATTAGVLGLMLSKPSADDKIAVTPWVGPGVGGVTVRGTTF